MSVKINLSGIVICLVITLNGCSVDKKGNVGIRFYEDSLDLLLNSNDFEQNESHVDKSIWQHYKDSKKQIEKNNINQTDIDNNDQGALKKGVLNYHIDDQEVAKVDILEVERLNGYLLQDSALSSVQSDIDYISERVIVNEDFNNNDIVSKIILEQDLLESCKKRLENNLNEVQKEALEFLEKALSSKVDKLNKILVLDEDEIKNMLDIISRNLNSIRDLESVNELILDFENLDSGELEFKMNDEIKVEYTEVKNDLREKIELSLDEYLSVIDANFNDDDIRSSIDNINSIEILSPSFDYKFAESSLIRED
ncbi:hypothetical protein bpSLO_001454 (plasmid) [Borrelia parkeri]|uniref:hypothetical protein n=1 Tax=Borrelia parkeri TaxID=141 RepID=UPI001FF1ADB3|nr:hypothetical protein [Borrelia parkeri]UPA11577.1 hypothetical protein bpSLO_001454 [Borrelia parkeri]